MRSGNSCPVVFNSAQVQKFRGTHLYARRRPEISLQGILHTIFRTFNCFQQIPADFDDQIDVAIAMLRKQPSLLIVDNFYPIIIK
ncbi:MAG: hypothetical protein WA865_07785 [Spirulinaceae cyanobacterium]